MKFRLKVAHAENPDGPWWFEDFDQPVDDPEKWAKDTCDEFNTTLREGELARVVLAVEVTDLYAYKDHRWIKQNLGTRNDHRGLFDIVQCSRCGIKARRYDLTRIVRQNPHRAWKFRRCDDSMRELGIDPQTVYEREHKPASREGAG